MVKLIVAYRHPIDAQEFERRYQGEHVAMARRIPHMTRIEFGKVVGMMDGSRAPYHRIAELFFDDQDAIGKAGSSPEVRPPSSMPARSEPVAWTPWSSR